MNERSTNGNNERPSGLFARLSGIPGGRRTKWIVLLAWIVIVAVVSPFAARLPDVEQNDIAQWLPDGAESLEVSRLQQQFPGSDSLPAVVIFHRAQGLTDSDLEQVEADRLRIAGHFADAAVGDVIPSAGNETAMFVVDLPDNEEQVVESVQEMRGLLSGSDGLEVMVTGSAGFTSDMVEVFDGIDTTLLAASALVVTVLLLLIYRSPFLWLVPLLVVGFAHQSSSAMIYGFVQHLGMVANRSGLHPR